MIALPCEDLAVQVMDAKVPLLLLDTCIILDIVRVPIREQMKIHDIKAVHTVIERAVQVPPGISVVISEQVKQEFLENIDKVEDEMNAELQKVQDRLKGINERITALSSTNINSKDNDMSLASPVQGRQIAEEIIQTSTILAANDDDMKKAGHRTISAKPPAAKGKESYKDCLIIESYLRLAGTLCRKGFSQNMVYVTSNSEDYQQDHSSLHPALRTEFEAVRLEYSPKWSAARYELDRQRTYEPERENVIINSPSRFGP